MLYLKNKLLNDYKKRVNFNKIELPFNTHLIIANNNILPRTIREKKAVKLFLNKSAYTQIKSRCLLSGRSRGNLTKIKLSRISFKEQAFKGFIPGVQRSSW